MDSEECFDLREEEVNDLIKLDENEKELEPENVVEQARNLENENYKENINE